MIVDVNAYLGHFAFRRLRHNTALALLKLMAAKQIDQAWVSSASAITYRNCQAGNEELAAEVHGQRDRLTPFAVINPAYAGWRDDLQTCHEKWGMRGLRLYPRWHNYRLDSKSCLELVNLATERGLVISIPLRVEDPREQSWLINVPDVPLAEIGTLLKACPKARFVLLNGINYHNSPLGRPDSGLPANYLLEISRLSALLDDEIGQLISRMGANRLVFGTGMPFNYPDPALLKLEVLSASQEDRDRIRGQNALKWLKAGT
jgi:predicted TIM-barrel fold metal-dependent hydrolase